MQEIINEKQIYNLEELLKNKNLSPMMKQYITLKLQYSDCILLSHVGDFWEIYLNDAIVLSNQLNLKLTKKSCGLDIQIGQCGFPYNRGSNTINTINNILKLGYKIALCEQLEDPKNPSGKIVKRDIIQIITPGTILDEDLLFDTNNFLASIVKIDDKIGFSYVDISTGEIFTSSFDESLLSEEISRVKPRELIILDNNIEKKISKVINNYQICVNNTFDKIKDDILNDYFLDFYLNKLYFPIGTKESLIQLLSYVFYTQKKVTNNLNNIDFYDVTNNMLLDSFTRDSLELTKRMKTNDKNGSLYSILDKTKTAMGARKLKQRIEQPFLDIPYIEKQLNFVEDLVNDRFLSEDLTNILNNVRDIERLCGRIAFDKITPREMINLKKSIEELPMLKNLILTSNCNYLKDFIKPLDDLKDIFLLLENSILEECNSNLSDGYIIKNSYNNKVEYYRNLLQNNNKILENIELEQKNILGINILKIGQTDTEGYYIQITKKNLDLLELPDEYKKVKELKDSYRYTFPKLRKFEQDKIEAEEKLKKIEYELFVDIRNKLSDNIARMKQVARILAELDVYLSLSAVSIENGYVRPNLNNENRLIIKNGRHPVIEKLNNNSFIGNDIYMDSNNSIHIITGPNMSGKSTYMRQIALITLMAQIGCFVPCDEADISICDRIFTRIGASDNLANGESTFMVEMNELSQILNNATIKSLILLDEVGRGTSTFDGISIAKATVEYISKEIKCHTLFATHYFELITLEDELHNVKNYKVEIKECDDEIFFLRKVVEGCSTKSYGIQVAKTVNLPNEVIIRAKNILKELESCETKEINNIKEVIKEVPIIQDSIVDSKIKELDLMNTTPMELFQFIHKLQKDIKNKL